MQTRHREGLVLAVEQARRDGTVITLPGPPADPESIRNTYGGDPLDDDELAFVTTRSGSFLTRFTTTSSRSTGRWPPTCP